MAEKIGNHKRVWEYGGAFKCLDCKAQWGALTGHPAMPDHCDGQSLASLIEEGRGVIRAMKRDGYGDILWERLLDAIETARPEARRNEILEEAARMCDRMAAMQGLSAAMQGSRAVCADAIRMLKNDETIPSPLRQKP